MAKGECTEAIANVLQKVYIAKVEALQFLHIQLGHMPYQRIERMLQLGVLTGVNLDKKLSHQLVCKVKERHMHQSQGKLCNSL
jgi:hypothetical protein